MQGSPSRSSTWVAVRTRLPRYQTRHIPWCRNGMVGQRRGPAQGRGAGEAQGPAQGSRGGRPGGRGPGASRGPKVDCRKITCRPMCRPSVILIKVYKLYSFNKITEGLHIGLQVIFWQSTFWPGWPPASCPGPAAPAPLGRSLPMPPFPRKLAYPSPQPEAVVGAPSGGRCW